MSAAAALRALHVPGRPLVLPNVWDVGSARAVAAAGHPVIATSSAAIAAMLGGADDDTLAPFDTLARIAAVVDVPVTADVEGGYGLPPGELAARLLDAGIAGCNIEDTDRRRGGLRDPSEQARYLAAVREAGLAVNARVDAQLRGGTLQEGLERARRYAQVADCVYPIHVTAAHDIAAYVEACGVVNVTALPQSPTFARVCELGVARVSFGAGTYKAALNAALALSAKYVGDAAVRG